MIFSSTISGGKISSSQVRRDIIKALKSFDGKRVDIEITDGSKKRSLSQNAYWFAALEKHAVPVFREYGDNWSTFSIHEFIMNELGYQEALTDNKGRVFVSRKHSSRFTTKQWEEYMERARAYLAMEHGIAIPLPNEIIALQE